ncbi:MAG: hypothetical protein Homavirus24_8 [Homavirus sp.]|uniref:Uncharacterized protein n=1 Tax=Homavirus sp. TaxID=2487769 RepID=A0A3G5A4W7_9VIRU|nr:MAG: hypothetical protein Homavirus24_8 [Homavirus sp.]
MLGLSHNNLTVSKLLVIPAYAHAIIKGVLLVPVWFTLAPQLNNNSTVSNELQLCVFATANINGVQPAPFSFSNSFG